MKVKVRLFGTLGKQFPNHDPIKELEVEIPENSNVINLLEQLNISRAKVGLISVDNRLVKADKILKQGDFVRVFHPIFGG